MREASWRAEATPLDHLPREVFFFLTLTGFPVAAACFCFFFAATSDLLVLARESFI
jgi:hypothetical protein